MALHELDSVVKHFSFLTITAYAPIMQNDIKATLFLIKLFELSSDNVKVDTTFPLINCLSIVLWQRGDFNIYLCLCYLLVNNLSQSLTNINPNGISQGIKGAINLKLLSQNRIVR